MKRLLLLTLLTAVIGATPTTATDDVQAFMAGECLETNTNEVTVYLCMGQHAYAYHSSAKCAGMNCSENVIAVTLSQAKNNYHRKPCGRCCNKEDYR
ncbi:MAG: hypothetical protein Q4D14_02905 [Bacteroidales bacterium]|nr:hypothetical protein [Bacteroidales bacterium]